jgi:hypothetical protein
MSLKAPFDFGPFTVDPTGRLTQRSDSLSSGFVFRWRGRTIRASVTETAEHHSRVALQAILGRIPSTAIAHDQDFRRRGFATLRILPGYLPDGWRIRLLADHRLRLETEASVGQPLRVTTLVTDLTCFLLSLDPYLDVLDEIGVTPSAAWT